MRPGKTRLVYLDRCTCGDSIPHKPIGIPGGRSSDSIEPAHNGCSMSDPNRLYVVEWAEEDDIGATLKQTRSLVASGDRQIHWPEISEFGARSPNSSTQKWLLFPSVF